MSEIKTIPHISYQQHRTVQRLVRSCCNYFDGNCLALDDGDACPCVQSVSRSLLCKWFRAAVLPQDTALSAALFPRPDTKRCTVCGAPFVPGSNRAKYCPACAAIVHRRQKTASERRRRGSGVDN